MNGKRYAKGTTLASLAAWMLAQAPLADEPRTDEEKRIAERPVTVGVDTHKYIHVAVRT